MHSALPARIRLWAPFSLVRRALYGKFPFRRGRRRAPGVTVSQSPEESPRHHHPVSPPPPPYPASEAHAPQPYAAGRRREGRKDTRSRPRLPPRPRPLPAPGTARREPMNRVGVRAWQSLQTPEKGWGLRSAPWDSQSQSESLGSLHSPHPHRLFTDSQPYVFPTFSSSKVWSTWSPFARRRLRGRVKVAAPALGELW